MSKLQICKRLDALLKFMEPYFPWVNSHMVNLITDKHWEIYVPVAIQEELRQHTDIDECIKEVFWSESNGSSTKFIECKNFVRETEKHCLENFQDVLTTKECFEREVLAFRRTGEEQKVISVKEFLSEKKRHEVEITSSLINDLITGTMKSNESAIVVDAGDGKGYLSSRLALEYGHKVLGIDSNPSNTKNALERNRKLKKAWNGLKERAELESKGITPTRKERLKYKQKSEENSLQKSSLNDNYKTVDKFITTDLDLPSLIKESFPDEPIDTSICLTGLHTCGNLAATCLKLFHHQPQCKVVCNIGCCYHFLREMYSGQEFFGNKHILDLNHEFGFPMSDYLQKQRVTLGRNGRMLAAQSMERTKAAKELPNRSLFYRALLEVLICESHPDMKDTVQVGKVRRFKDFEEYVEMCSKKYPALNIPIERIEAVTHEYKDVKSQLDMFYLLRMTLAPVLESIILLDRLLYLKECGYSQSYLMGAFDAVVSPRRYAVIAIKD